MSEAKLVGAEAVVKAGGIAATKAKTDRATTGPLVAVVYRHPANPERTFVRLVEESLRPAIDAEMSAMGFAPPENVTSVGQTRKRALGFPAAAVVQHPKKAHFALEVMRDFRRAATRARTKPGHANDAFALIGKKLERSVPAFLPSFWEEVGRTFLVEEATTLAAQSFEKARAAERGYKLKVDEDERAGAYLEFATAGAVPAKSLIGYAADLTKAFPAAEAARRFVKLNVQRIKAGLPPWTGMAKEIGKLASTAKLPKLEAEFVEEILGASSLKKAAPDFWTAYLPILRDLTRAPEAKRKLVMLFPKPRGFAKFLPTWLAFLDEIGAVAMLAAGPQEEAARFVSALTLFVTHDDDEAIPAAYYRFFDGLAPGIARAGVAVDLASDGWNKAYALDILETALEHGLTLAPRAIDIEDDYDNESIELGREFRKDPVRIAAHPELSKLLDKSVGRVIGETKFEALAKGKSGLVASRRRWLMTAIDKLATGALPRFGSEVDALVERSSAQTFAEFPEAAAALGAVDVGKALAQTLRGGILDELTWPAFEDVLADLGPKVKVEFYGTVQHPIVRAGRKVIVFDGADKLMEVDLPPAAKDPDDILFLDGDVYVEYDDAKSDEHLALWMSKPKSPFPVEQRYGRSISDALPVPGGGVILGHAVVHAGDTPKKLESRDLVSDGALFWLGGASWHERLKLAELDPQTGKSGRTSWPAFVTEVAGKTDDLRLVEVALAPTRAHASRLGVANGLTGYWKRSNEKRDVFELVRVDGKRWQGQRTDVVIDWPGGVDRGLDIDTSWSRDEDDEIEIRTAEDETPTAKYGGDDDDRWLTGAFPHLPRAAWFHYLDARDEAASVILRNVSDDVGRALAEAAEEEAEDDMAIDATIAAVKTALPGIANAEIVRGIAFVAKQAARLAVKLEGLRAAESGEGVTDDAVREALPQAPTSGGSDGFCTVEMARVGAAFVAHTTGKLSESSVAWDECIEQLVKLACFVASRTKPEDPKRATLRALVDGIGASGLPGLTVTRATLEVSTTSSFLERPKNKDVWLASVGAALWFVRIPYFDEDEPQQTVHVLLQGAALVVPKDATVTAQTTFTIPDDRAFAEQFWRELDARGPVAYDPTAADLVAAESSLGRTEATLLLAGLPGQDTYDHDFLGKELRATLGLKVTDAARAKEALDELPNEKLAALVMDMASVPFADGYWKTAAEEGSTARSLISAATRLLGRSVVIREDLVTLLKKNGDFGLSERRALTLLLTAGDPDNPLLQLPKKKPDWFSCGNDDEAFGNDVIVAAAKMIPLLATHLPVGDEHRSALPVLHERVLAILEQPDLLIELGRFYGNAEERTKLVAMIVGKPFEVTRGERTWTGKDDGLVQVIWHGEDEVDIALRTSALKKRRASLLPFLTLETDDFGVEEAARAALYLLSTECATLIDRIRKTPVPDGAFELNPLVSAKKLVATVRDELGVDDAAATLYLQILALPNPQQKQLVTMNGWTAATYDAAANVLVKKKLFVEGKRERAGRSVFLPGAWEKKSSGVSVEAYKLPFYDRVSFDQPMVTTAPHELYARAWKRWSSGDKPGYEDVEKRKKKV